MKKILFVSLAVVIVGALFLGSCSSSTPGSQEVIQLTSSNYLPIAHAFTPLQEAWGKGYGPLERPGSSPTILAVALKPDRLEKGIADMARASVITAVASR
jgi:hypothetical protein